MIIQQFKQTLKGIRATKLYSIINIIGLALGLTCTIFITKYILSEYYTNRSLKNFDSLYFSVLKESPLSNYKLSGAKLLTRKTRNIDYHKVYPQIKLSTTIQFGNAEITSNNKSFPGKILVSDNNFQKVVGLALKIGNLDEMLKEPNHVILSEKMTMKIFGEKNPIGEQIEYQRKPFKVAGVLEDLSNCSFDFDIIFHEKGNYVWNMAFWDLILLNKNSNINELNEQVEGIARDRSDLKESSFEFRPMKDFYFSKELEDRLDIFQFGNRQSLYILGIIAFCILAISIFNFINIYNVTLIKRAKEFGIKKVLGASRRNSVFEFAREIFLLILLSVFLSILFSSILKSVFQNIAGKDVPSTILDLTIYSCAIITLTFVALIYPTTKYSGISPVVSIRESFSGKSAVLFRKLLMSAQYIVTIGLLIIALFFIKQLNYMLKKDMGFNHERIIKVEFFSRLLPSSYTASTMEEMQKISNDLERLQEKQKQNQQYIINEIDKNPYLQHLSFGNDPLSVGSHGWRNSNESKDYQDVYINSVTPNFLKLYGLQITEGRFFSSEIDKGGQNKIVINEATKEYFNISSFDNAFLFSRYQDENTPYQVIGVVKNFSFQHLSSSVKPLVMSYYENLDNFYWMMKITKGKEAESIVFLKNLFEEVNPGKNFEYEFVEDHVMSVYKEDKKVAKIYSLFAVIAMIISSMGLFSFSVFDVQQRFKEIGIRKVNGAKETQIISLLTANFMTVILLSFLIACPVALYLINRYLENFANKTNISIWIFLFAAMFTFIIAYLTLIWQSWKAATRNPVEALRYE